MFLTRTGDLMTTIMDDGGGLMTRFNLVRMVFLTVFFISCLGIFQLVGVFGARVGGWMWTL